MLERLLIALALVLLSAGGFVLFRWAYRRRASQATTAASQPLILYFRSDACAPCVPQGHYVQQVQGELGDAIRVEKIDADRDPTRAERYGVFTLPTTLIVDTEGTVRYANYGLADARKLLQQLRALMPAGSIPQNAVIT